MRMMEVWNFSIQVSTLFPIRKFLLNHNYMLPGSISYSVIDSLELQGTGMPYNHFPMK